MILLDAAALKPFDLIFTGARTARSRAVQTLTASRYSHVLMVLSPFRFVEAVSPRVRATVPEDLVVGWTAAQSSPFLLIDGAFLKANRVAVFRHRQLANQSVPALLAQFPQVASNLASMIGHDYAKPGKLSRTLIPRRLLARLDSEGPIPDDQQSFFCSEFALQLLRAAGAPITSCAYMSAAEVTPARLARSRELTKVENAVVKSAPTAGAVRDAWELGHLSLRRSLARSDSSLYGAVGKIESDIEDLVSRGDHLPQPAVLRSTPGSRRAARTHRAERLLHSRGPGDDWEAIKRFLGETTVARSGHPSILPNAGKA